MKNRQNKNDRKRQRRKDFSNGRNWQAAPQDQRSPHPQSGNTGRIRTQLPAASWRTINSFDLSPGAINAIDPGVTANVTADLQKMRGLIDAQMFSTLLYGMSIRGSAQEDQRPALKREMQVGEIVGHRCWRLEDGILRSVYMKDWWRPNTVMTGRELEDWDQRGIHAWKEPNSKEFNDYIRGYMKRKSMRDLWLEDYEAETPTIITGTIFLWGDVVEHEHGYRGEYASVRSIDWIYPDAEYMGRERETLFHLRERYNVH